MEQAPIEPAAPPAKRRSSVLPVLIAAVLAGGAGTGAGFAIRSVEANPPISRAPADAESEPFEWSWRVNSDALEAGAFSDALSQSRVAAETLPKSERHTLAYRTALALEGLDRIAEALEHYRQAGEAGPRTAITPLALLGAARCLGRERQFEQARLHLARATLLAGLAGEHADACLADCAYLRAWLGAMERARVGLPDPFDPRDPSWDVNVHLLDRMPKLLACVATPPSPQVPTANGDPLQADAKDARRISAKLCTLHGPEFVEAIAKMAKKPLRILGTAGSVLRDLDVELAAEATPHELLLESVAEIAGLDVLLNDTGFTFQDAAKNQDVARLRHELAVIHALRFDPAHPLAPSARLWEVNAKFDTDALAARKGYEQILASRVPTGVRACASLNLGLCELARSNFAEARRRFHDAGDERSSASFEPLGRWWAGRAHLEEARLADARKCFLASRWSPDPELRSAAALGLTLCDILSGRNDAARTRVRDSRIAVLDAHIALADGLAAWFVFGANPTAHRKQSARDAAQHAKFEAAFGSAGRYFAGQVFLACGAPERTEELYRDPTPRGVFATLMLGSLADAEFERDERASARSKYSVLASQEDEAVATHARLRLAELAERAGNGVECEAQARLALVSRHADRAVALRLIGRGCELQRRHRDAAEAYAGRVPQAGE